MQRTFHRFARNTSMTIRTRDAGAWTGFLPRPSASEPGCKVPHDGNFSLNE